LDLVLNITAVNRLTAVPNTRFTEPLLKFMQEFNFSQLI